MQDVLQGHFIRAMARVAGARITCFTSTKVRAVLVQKDVQGHFISAMARVAGAQITCFTSTKVRAVRVQKDVLVARDLLY